MSIQEQVKILQWKLKSEFPIEQLDQEDFNADHFLMQCLSGKSGNVFDNARQLKTDLETYSRSIERTLNENIHSDYEKILELPAKLYAFDHKIHSVQAKAHEFFQKLSVYQATLKENKTLAAARIDTDVQERAAIASAKRALVFQTNLQELDQNIDVFKKVSNACLSKPRALTHGALVRRISSVMKTNLELLGEEYHGHTTQQKSDFLLALSRELVGWSTQPGASKHFAVLLDAYTLLGLEVEAQLILKDRVVLPHFKEVALMCQDPLDADAVSLPNFLEAVRNELALGKFQNFNTGKCGLLIRSFCTGVIQVMSAWTRLFSPTFYSEFIRNFTESMHFVEFVDGQSAGEFKQSTVYEEFIERWNLPTYFELRKSDIISPVCELLKETSLEAFLAKSPETRYINSLQELDEELKRMPDLNARFVRLSLQMVATFVNFITKQLNLKAKAEGTSIDTLLKVVNCVERVKSSVPFQASLREGTLAMLNEVLEPCSRCLGEAVTRQCQTNLEALKSVPAVYRMTNRPFPTAASSFVPSFLLPLKQVGLDTPQRSKVVDRVAATFLELLAEVMASVKKSGDLLSKYTSSSEDQGKMCEQLKLDAAAFLRELEEMGFTVENNEILRQISLQIEALST